MARPIWDGHITFGLVNVPVKLYNAEKRTDIHFQMLDNRNHAKVRYQRVNEETGEEVPWNEIVRAYEYDDGNFVLLSEDELKSAKVEASQTIEIEDFIDYKDIPPLFFDKPYFLVPGKKGEKGYVLLREALQRTGKSGIAKVVIRTRQYLSALFPLDNFLILNILRFKQELKDKEDFNVPEGDLEDYKISDKEIDMATKLIENLSGDWQPEQYHDEYREALQKYIDEKIKQGKTDQVLEPTPKETQKQGDVIDMMDLLQESVEKTSKSKSSSKKKNASSKKGSQKRKSG